MLWEAMIAEIRAAYLDLHARATFAEDGKSISDTRGEVAKALHPEPTAQQIESKLARSASRLRAASDGGFVEVG